MALAEAPHHSSGTTPSKRNTRVVEGAKYEALRGQKTVTRAGEGEVREEHQALRGQTRLHLGMRPALLVEVPPQGRLVRHFAEHMAELAPLVQILDAPVPQLEEQLVDVFNIFRLIDTQTPVEQVIEVPEISLPSRCCRTVLSAPQMAEQLVEVPTVVSFSSLQQLSVEQIIDIPVPRLGGRSVAQNVDTPVLHGRGSVSGSGLQDFRPGQSSSAVSEQTVSPAPRREGSRGGVQGFSPGQGSTTFPPPERISERIMEQNVDFPGGGLHGVQGFLTRQSSAALSEQVPVSAVYAATAPVVEFMASAPSVHAAPGSSGDDASRVEQDIDVEGGLFGPSGLSLGDLRDARYGGLQMAFPWRRHLPVAAQLRGRQGLPLPVLAAPSVAHRRLHLWTRASWWQQRSVLAVARP